MPGHVISVRSQLTDPNVRVTRVGRHHQRGCFLGVISNLTGIARYCCFDDGIENANTAILERVFYHAEGDGFARPFIPDMAVVSNVLNGFRQAFSRRVACTVPVDFRVYPEENYRGRKLRIYQKARDNVIARTYDENKFGRLKTFIKHEKILEKPKRLVPRVIQPRSPEFNVCVGRYIRQLEHRIYAIVDELWGGPTVMKGLNCVQQGAAIASAWATFSDPVALMLDAVRFDQHVSVPMLSWEHSIYLEFFPRCYRPELEWLLSLQLFNQGTVRCHDGTLTYKVEGCRASGDMNTAMGNVLIMCACVYAMVQGLRCKARLINNGDDCCLILERADVRRVRDEIPSFFRELGFIIDVQGSTDILERVRFCQTSPVYNGKGWVMVRDPNTAISKDVTILRRWSMKEYAVYLRELGIAGLAAYGDMPVYSSFYRCLSRSKLHGKVSSGLVAHVRSPILDSGLGRLSQGLSSLGGDVTDASRTSFAVAFGITPVVQRCIEAYYDACDPGDGAVHAGHPRSYQF